MFQIIEKSTGKVVGSVKTFNAENALSIFCWLWKEDSSKFEAK